MAPRPTAERPPTGLDSFWTHTWNHALKVLKEQGTWKWEQKPLLDEYILALREARWSREEAEKDPYHETEKGLLHPHPGFAQADRAARRAVLLADTLLLTPAEQRKLSATSSDNAAPKDPFEEADELAKKRAKKSA